VPLLSVCLLAWDLWLWAVKGVVRGWWGRGRKAGGGGVVVVVVAGW
jgi:hypothetical protein